MKQTAVEWLIEKVNEQSTGLGMYGMNVRIDIPADIIQQAKEMEKEHMMQCHYDGQRIHSKSITHSMLMDNCESYWQETFNTNEK